MTNFAYTFTGDEELLKEMVYRHGAVYSSVAAHKEFMVRFSPLQSTESRASLYLAIRRRDLLRLSCR